MEPLPLRTVLDVLQGHWRSPSPLPDSLVIEVSTDTRTIRDSSLFVALSGERFDGHAYVEDASGKGALASVVSEHRVADLPPGGSYIAVDDPLSAMERIAVWNRDRLAMTVVAVTGSVGKTSTKEFLATILSDEFRVCCAPKSFNNRIGVAATLISASPDTEVLVAELGASGPGELSHLSRVVRPHRIVVTEIAAAHLEGFGDLDGVVRAKAEVFEGLVDGGSSFLRYGVRGFSEFASRARGPVHTFGFEKGDYAVTAWQRVSLGSCMKTRCSRGDYGYLFTINGSENLLLPVPGRHNIANATAAIAVARDLGMSWETIRSSLATCRLPPLRLHVYESGGVVLVDDSYNSNPASMRAAIQEWVSLSETPECRDPSDDAAGESQLRERMLEPGLLRFRRSRVAVVGDMLELGDHSRRAHEDVGGELGEAGCRLVVTVGEDSRWVGSACSRVAPDTEVVHFDDPQESQRFLQRSLRAGDHVLFKGSRRIGLDRVVSDLREWLGATPRAAATLRS